LARQNIIGLLGSRNGNVNDDWIQPDGTPLPPPASDEERLFSSAYDYCTTNWCVSNAADSIFEYGTGELFSSIYQCDAPYSGDIESQVENPPFELVLICGTSLACLVDGLCGDATDAEQALAGEELIDLSQAESLGSATNVSLIDIIWTSIVLYFLTSRFANICPSIAQ